ncbi:uncharacterized protein BT62DRAFT_933744 [Guyanagaster necrorhizus]|uniref:Arrestin-like N-terminal domain-containing protein n=1 Tax=Guyanagaster necrorhizus TaxID=856835 RepID=A0A9P8ARB0_9AGAR|nr:uncharacterized protein BT62DRAFT_933744 [Guyanagaster necrorhizus MCA 3950]KAG7444696.1 hypothetical protein BT62DRAFT_933744 [Guyanagaster necrorhizus MCA 3950]
MALQHDRPQLMNSSPTHPKVKISMDFSDPLFVGGTHVCGQLAMECRADKGLGISGMMVELFGTEELLSRDHTAKAPFLYSRRLFQGPGLPPSNAVHARPAPGDLPLPSHYYQAKRGKSTFNFRIPIPSTSPSTINFASGSARVRYEVRASVQVFWRGEKKVVTDTREVNIVESFEEDFSRAEPETVAVGENGKIWIQGKIVGGIIVAGEPACIELQVKNHSTRRNTGLIVSLSRTLHLGSADSDRKKPLQISDSLLTVPFRLPEYIIPPGAEGVASLVFDVPGSARSVKGGHLEGDKSEARRTDALFEIRASVEIKMTMGLGNKDIIVNVPVVIVHPAALPDLPPLPPQLPNPFPHSPASPQQYYEPVQSPYAYPALPMPPPIPTYVDHNLVWMPPSVPQTPQPCQYFPPPVHQQQHYYLPPPTMPVYTQLPRPSSAGPSSNPRSLSRQSLLPLPQQAQSMEPEAGKGERASRVTQHLRLSSRNRSVSPLSHRYPLPSTSNPIPISQSQQNLPRSVIFPHLSLENLAPISVSDNVVHSPRPVLSPKRSYAPLPNSLPKSERVEVLERLADEVGKQTKDLSGDIPKDEPVDKSPAPPRSDLDKTLPGPPVPSGKVPPSTQSRPRADLYFANADPIPITPPEPAPAPLDHTPPTPTLTAITPHKRVKNGTGYLGAANTENGLDALERRLLAEVGTRKFDVEERGPDARTALAPIDIPKKQDPETLNDSAISSLTLADDHEWEEKTHRGAGVMSNASGDEGRRETSGKSVKGSPSKEKDGDKRSGKKKRDGDTSKMRKAKGRVAEWLGGMQADPPPAPNDPSPDMYAIEPEHAQAEVSIRRVLEVIDVKEEETQSKEMSSPDHRSSGFVPIGTLKRDLYTRTLVPKDASPPEDVKQITDLWAASSAHKAKATSIQADRKMSPPSMIPPTPPIPTNPWKSLKSPAVSPKKDVPPSSRLAVSPSSKSTDPEVKYGVRSARGGRGGKVTAVAAIWASGAVNDGKGKDVQPASPSPLLKPRRSGAITPTAVRKPPIAPKPPPVAKKPVIKSTSVPAILSSSHATPTLSSTASLAKPPLAKPRSPVTLPPTISEMDAPAKPKVSPAPVVDSKRPADLAFGQAKLRDLIKKYQG